MRGATGDMVACSILCSDACSLGSTQGCLLLEETSTADSAPLMATWLRPVSPLSPATTPASIPAAAHLLQRLRCPIPWCEPSGTSTRGAAEAPNGNQS
jgi:hypothetical protein